MLTLASFNGGPSDSQALTGLVIVVLVTLVGSALLKSASVGAILGAIVGSAMMLGQASLYGGYLGAEYVLAAYAIGGAIIGGIGGGISSWIKHRRDRRP